MKLRAVLNWLNNAFRPVHIEGQEHQLFPSENLGRGEVRGGFDQVGVILAQEAPRQNDTSSQDKGPG